MDNIEYKDSLELLKLWSKKYYESTPIATDEEYDKLYHKVKDYEKANRIDNPDSITNTIGSKNLSNKIEHLVKMYSMEDLFSPKEIEEWLANKTTEQFYIMPKYDGCSLNLTYDKGKLIRAVTRGDGTRGESVLHNIPYVKGIPMYIEYKGKIEIRGEIVIPKNKFEELNLKRMESELPTFSNPRNLASGSIRVKNENIEDRHLTFVPWGLGYNDIKLPTYDAWLHWLKGLGFSFDSYGKVVTKEKVVSYCSYLEEHRDELKYQLDGAVIRVNDLSYHEVLGYTDKYPKGMVAFKFKAIEVVTILKDVRWQVGKTGVITPVGVLNPIDVSGVIVTNVTLHNVNYIKTMDIKIGDTISIIRSGDVIPKIANVFKGRRTGSEVTIPEPNVCPSCNSEVAILGAYTVCSNDECPSRVINKIIHYGSKKACNINGLGDKVVEQLYNASYIKDIKDLYKLTVEDLLVLDGFSKVKANNLLEAIDGSKGIPLSRFIYGLNIPTVGEVNAKSLSKLGYNWYNTPANLLIANDNLGIKSVDSILEYVNKNKQNIIELMSIVQPSLDIVTTTNVKVVMTGTLSKSRDAFKELLENKGVTVSNSVTKDVNYLIIGSEPGGSKLTKAKSLGIPTLTELEAVNKFNIL